MDPESDEYRLKELLVNLEQEHKHLQASVDHLSNHIVKLDLDLRKLSTDRQLEQTKAATKHARDKPRSRLLTDTKFSSEYSKQVSELLDKITKTSEEVTTLIKL